MPPLNLLRVDPGAVEFVNSSGGVTQAKVTLVNTSGTAVAFKVKTTASKTYVVKPGSGSIRRGGTAEVIVVQKPPEDLSPEPQEKGKKPDRFLVQAAAVETEQQQLLIHAANRGKAAGSSKFWDSVTKEQIEEQQLEATFSDAPAAAVVAPAAAASTAAKSNNSTNGLPSAEDVDAILGKISKPGRSVILAKPSAASGAPEVTVTGPPKLESVGSPRREGEEGGGSVLAGKLLKKAQARRKEDAVMNKHSRPVTCVTIEPLHNSVLFTCAKDKFIFAWRLPDGEFIRSYEGHRGAVWSCSVSPDGMLLLSSAADNMVLLWEVATANQLTEVQMPGVARCIEWQPPAPGGGRWRFAVCSNSFAKRPAMLKVMEFGQAESELRGAEPKTLMGPVEEPILPSAASQVAWAGPSCEHICSVHTSGEILFWSILAGTLKGNLQAHEGLTSQVGFSNSRDLMASCGRQDCEVKLWDLRQGFDQVVQLMSFKCDRPLNAIALRPSLTADEVANCKGSKERTLQLCDVVAGGGMDAKDVALSGAGAENQFEPVLLRLGSSGELEEHDEEKGLKGGGHFGPINTVALWQRAALCISGAEEGNVRMRDLGGSSDIGSSPRKDAPPVALAPQAAAKPQPEPAAAKQQPEPKAKAKAAGKSAAARETISMSAAVPAQDRFVAIYDFDPVAANWPAKSQHQPLPLSRGQEVILKQNLGQGWAFGRSAGPPVKEGLYPTNYVLPYTEYLQRMQAYQSQAESAALFTELQRQTMGAPPSPQFQSKAQTLSLGHGLGLGQQAASPPAKPQPAPKEAAAGKYGHAEGELGLGDMALPAGEKPGGGGEEEEDGDCAQS